MNAEAIIKDFRSALKRYTRKATCGQYFILVDKLQDWLRSLVEPDVTNAAQLLHVAFSSRDSPGLPINPQYLLPGDNCCLLIFCILLDIGCPASLPTFSRKDKVDRLIPLRWATVQDTFRAAGIDDLEIQTKFFELQYRFRPAKFDLYLGADWEINMVVPICEKNSINTKGGTADLWQIAVPEEFVGQKLRDISSGSRFDANQGTDKEPDWQYQFALKSFHGSKYDLYKDEMDALRGLKDHEGMVRWLADYKKTHIRTDAPGQPKDSSARKPYHTTYNILLEYGEMDLSNYFVEIEPPVRTSDIEDFWRSVFAVADAVKGIHNLRVHDAGITMEYHGWHTDIKPDNILYVEERLKLDRIRDHPGVAKQAETEKAFKLADPGFAKFIPKLQEKAQATPKQVLNGGTETYGAPEYPGQSERPVSQAIDIWSLGCVFSLAATWVILGLRGVFQFQAMREQAIRELQPEFALKTPTNGGPKYPQGDHFHNGHQVLQDVTRWHEHLRTVLRKSDDLTSQVLDLIDEAMLLGPADQRITAIDLCSKLESILVSRPQSTTSQMPNSIRTSLGAFAFTRQLRNPSSFERPLRTTYRQPLWLETGSRAQQKGWLENNNDSIQDPASPPSPSPHRTPVRADNVKNHGRLPSDASIITTPRNSRRRGPKKAHSPLNVFQAREALDQRKKERYSLSKMLHRSKQDEFQDGLLTSYFQGTRDIMFLVDNAESMGAHWYEATFLIRTLVEMAQGVDKDGMDLRFTTGTTELEGKDSAEKFVNSMASARPIKGARTDLRMSLGNILNSYADKLKTKAKYPTNKVKDLVLVILTDGVWAAMQNKIAIATQLKTISKQLDYELKQRPFSVQFIQFGDDETATQALRYLDDYFDDEGKLDFIDTEHSSGDVNKMLLGSFVEEYDKDEGDEENPFDSPHTDPRFSPPLAQQPFEEYVTALDTREQARVNLEQIGQGIPFTLPSRPNHTRSFQLGIR